MATDAAAARAELSSLLRARGKPPWNRDSAFAIHVANHPDSNIVRDPAFRDGFLAGYAAANCDHCDNAIAMDLHATIGRAARKRERDARYREEHREERARYFRWRRARQKELREFYRGQLGRSL